ncbi:MAG: hypothetical protein COW18_10045 [Zetaproteobacteria bacterium CG12_big_fil_rev_8_21_14_0_65_54_13]|nr:MAG: hypothetical protein COW18_10045 [Zetaproteobacteria bacterium CG12_big_fil_rev_8_21_14_0_65_54_13]PIX55856.1 MAG: hypothetical protein COZ50_00565 [Zetaproteobacteria bacterium CG_4_10_14_3_um_filter_54_28]PJA30674.1 MAG: hypothetical protein CO188_02445 [Zetaproteobacteria bacterium CG_4_9_14_3_um_filter_54_145]
MFRFCAVLLAMIATAGVSLAAETVTDPLTGMTFVLVPAGCFQFTAASADKSGAGAAQVCLPSDIWMSSYEVTQEQYSKIMGTNPSGFKKGGRYPVERVRWFDAVQFIRKLNKQSGKQFRLPSEAEWEYAARSGGKDATYGASGTPDQVAWYMRNSKFTSHPVGEKKANALGLYDMSGNVWEWVQDCWNADINAAPKDASAQTQGQCTARVLRGGSWYDAAEMITTGSRLWNDADKLDNNTGFRLVLEP